MKKKVPFLAIILGVVLIVIAVLIPSGSEQGSFARMANMLPEDIGQLSFFNVGMLQNDEDLPSTWNSIKKNLLGSDFYGENVSDLTALGMAGSQYELMLYAGDFDFEKMKSNMENESLESFAYEGITIWTDQSASSTAVIGDVVFVGSSDDIQRCIDISKGKGTSLYGNNDAKDIMNRLPDGYILGVASIDESSSASNYGLVAAGMAASKEDGNISQMSLLKFNGSDAAQGYVTRLRLSGTEGYDIVSDGQYITISQASAIPSLEEQAYDSAYSDLQNAVVTYVTEHDAFPTINGTVNINGSDYQIIDICSLASAEGGTLSEVPEGIASIDGANNDNCDTGCEGCLETNHYIWAVDDYGYIYSTCVDDGCDANGEDGYQGVWP